jgi:mono/diheme cytochrome c family protein
LPPWAGFDENLATLISMKHSSSPFLLIAGVSILGLGACASNPGSASAPATPPPAAVVAKVDYTRQVQPIFSQYCYQCHGNGRQSGGVRLDAKDSALKHITPGDPDNSDVYRAITRSQGASDHMPPITQDQPADSDIATIKQWITEGANWPDSPGQ